MPLVAPQPVARDIVKGPLELISSSRNFLMQKLGDQNNCTYRIISRRLPNLKVAEDAELEKCEKSWQLIHEIIPDEEDLSSLVIHRRLKKHLEPETDSRRSVSRTSDIFGNVIDDTWSDTYSMPDVDPTRSIIRKISTNGIKNRRFSHRTRTDNPMTVDMDERLSSLTWMDFVHFHVLNSTHPLALHYQSFYQNSRSASFTGFSDAFLFKFTCIWTFVVMILIRYASLDLWTMLFVLIQVGNLAYIRYRKNLDFHFQSFQKTVLEEQFRCHKMTRIVRWLTNKAIQQKTEFRSVEISSPHPISNIRFFRCTSPLKEHGWWKYQDWIQSTHHEFWQFNNTEFDQKLSEWQTLFYQKHDREPTAQELSVYYKNYLKETQSSFNDYQTWWMKQNFGMIFEGLRMEARLLFEKYSFDNVWIKQ